MIKMHLNSIRSDLLCTGPHSGACKESRPQLTSQIDDVTVTIKGKGQPRQKLRMNDLVLAPKYAVFWGNHDMEES